MESSDVQTLKEKEFHQKQFLNELREKLNSKNINFEFEDKFLIKFLRSRLYNVNDAFNLIKMYVQMFNKHPEFFTGVDFVREAIKTGTFQIFPERNVTGETIANMKPGNWNPDEVSFEAMMVSTIYAFEVDKLQEESQIYPTIEIIDCKNLSLKQVMKVGLSEIRLGAEMTEHTLPIRWRKLFIVNENYLIDILYNMAKMFLSKEFRERLAFIGNNFTELHKMVPPHLLPPEYGGTSGKCDIDRFLERIEKMEEQLMKLWEPFKKQKISI